MEKNWLIWSWEHNAWWRPERMGYTPELEQAGHYSQAEAEAICLDANRYAGERMNEQMVEYELVAMLWRAENRRLLAKRRLEGKERSKS